MNLKNQRLNNSGIYETGTQKTYIQSIFRFIQLQVMDYLIRKRWVLPVLTAILLASSETNRLLMRRATSGLAYNLWDVLFSVFSNTNYILFILDNMFFFLICDLPNESLYGQGLLEKLGSRGGWWISKVIVLATLVLFFALINLFIVVGIASFTFPWQSMWSSGALSSTVDSYLNVEIMSSLPLIVFLKTLFLLILGWFSLGLLVLIFSSLSRHSFVGFMTGVIVNFSGLIFYKGFFSPLVDNFSFHQHMILVLQYSENGLLRFDPFVFSLLYWFCWIVILFCIGLFLAKRSDFYSVESSL